MQGIRPMVLVVDDDPIVLDVVSALLRQVGFCVLSSSSPVEAYDLLQVRNEIAVVVSDYEMPQMNGEQFAHAAKQVRPTLPVYILSGKLPPTSGSAPWDGWFVKGGPITSLVQQLRTVTPLVQGAA